MAYATRTIIKSKVSLLAFSLSASAVLAEPLPDHDNGPFTGIFGMPDSTEGATLLPAGGSAWTASIFTSNHSMGETKGNEALLLDGETTRFELRYRYGVSSRLELGIELPYVWHESGTLDPLVDGFHDMFGLPGGIRPDRPRNILEFYYYDGVDDPIAITRSTRGVGDLRLFAGWQLSDRDGHRTALRFGLKFPTGDGRDLHGSGGTDVSLGLAGDVPALSGAERISAFYRASAVYLSRPHWLADRHRSLVGHVAGGFGYRVSERAAFQVQAVFRTAAYRSDVETLGDPSFSVTLGGNLSLTEKLRLSFGVVEDLDVRSVPDVSFQLALHYQPQ